MHLEIIIAQSLSPIQLKTWLAYFYEVIFTFCSLVAHKTGKCTFITSQELSAR